MGLLRKTLGNYLAQHRRNLLSRKFAEFGRFLCLSFENSNYDFYRNGEYDVLRKLSGRDLRTIFDVGANVGRWTTIAAELFPQAKVYCFEIIEATLRELKRNVQHRTNVIVHEFGLSDREQEVTLTYYPEANGRSSMYDYPHKGERELLKGKTKVGDDIIQKDNIERVDFLKIDVEGAEHLVLEGFRKSIAMGKIEIIQFEYGLVNILSKFLLYDFYGFFKEYGYEVGKIYPGYVEFRDYDLRHEDFLGPNFIAVRQERADVIKMLSR